MPCFLSFYFLTFFATYRVLSKLPYFFIILASCHILSKLPYFLIIFAPFHLLSKLPNFLIIFAPCHLQYLPDCLTSLLFLTVGSCYLAYFPNFFPLIPPAYVPFLLHFSKLHILSPLFSFLAIFLWPPSYPVLPSLPLPLSQTMYG